MAADKLSLYNHALMLLGQRVLDSLTEDRPNRYYLDTAYDTAVDYCLEIVQPVFASKVVVLNTPTASVGHALQYSHTLPSDYVSMVGVYSDAELDRPVARYVTSGDTIECDYDTLYLRYTSNAFDFTVWSASFDRVVHSYLAREISFRAAPDTYDRIEAKFIDRVEAAKQLEGEKEPLSRSTQPVGTLSIEWLKIYNDALLIMGLPELTTGTDDSDRRVKLDRALDTDLVEGLLETTGWSFGTTSIELFADPSLEPGWGHTYAFKKPDNLLRIRGMFLDEYLRNPMKFYNDEGSYWFCDWDRIYVEYVRRELLTTPADWPVFFRKLVAARMAKDAALSLSGEGADVQRAEFEYDKRESDAKSNDAMQSPPRVLSSGSWSRSRSPRGYDSDKRR